MSGNKRRFSIVLCISFFAFLAGCARQVSSPVSASGNNGVVVSEHPLASEIGLNVLKSGGNAIDAAVATGLALGVVDQYNCGLGGGAFVVIRMADGTVYTIDGREMAPGAATRDMYIREGKFDPSLSQRGPLAAGVPGVPAAYVKALEIAGTRSLAELAAPSVTIAREGFELDEFYVSNYVNAVKYLKMDPASSKIYFHSDGSLLKAGEIFAQPDLAKTYERLAEGGLDYFYKGEFAQRVAGYMADHGGLITVEDMKNYRAMVREPVVGMYGDFTIFGMGPPSSGGVHTIEMLNMIEASGVLRGKTSWDADAVFRVVQFMSQAFQDRALYLGDGDFYPVPVERLTDKAYADSLVSEIMARDWVAAGRPEFETVLGSGHTTNFCVIDQWGNAVAINHTVNLSYGAAITVPGTGVVLNCEMDDFSAQPGVANFFGLIGGEANAINPGKRPLSSMSPTIIVKGEKPVVILGGAGGSKIITAVLQTIVGVLDFGLSLEDALAMPRFHHQFMPDILYVEEGISDSVRAALRTRGYKIVEKRTLGDVRAIAWSDKLRAYVGAADPRARNGAMAY